MGTCYFLVCFLLSARSQTSSMSCPKAREQCSSIFWAKLSSLMMIACGKRVVLADEMIRLVWITSRARIMQCACIRSLVRRVSRTQRWLSDGPRTRRCRVFVAVCGRAAFSILLCNLSHPISGEHAHSKLVFCALGIFRG
jgi:hypothetical protein